jgi:SPP1 gp7 family putative phage head morphogenesis protein
MAVATKIQPRRTDVAANKDTRQKLLKELKDKAPSSRAQTGAFGGWNEYESILGQPYDPTNIPYSKLYQMRRHAMIAFATHFIRVPLVRAEWYMKCESAKIAAHADAALRPIIGSLILQMTESYNFGSQGIVKRMELAYPDETYIDPLADPEDMEKPVWDEGGVPALMFKPFVALRPELCWPRFNGSGEFNGLEYEIESNVAFPVLNQSETGRKRIPLEYSLWYTNDKDSVFGSVYGYPLIAHAYRYWWTDGYTWMMLNKHIEKDADPALVVYHPDEEFVDETTGETTAHAERALAIGEDVRSNSTIALPNGVVEQLDGRMTSQREWSIEFLQGGGNFETFMDLFQYLDIMMLRSLWIPEQSLVEGPRGTSSKNVASEMGDVFFESQAVRMKELDHHINRFVIRPWLQVNYPEYRGKCEKVTRGFGKYDEALAKQIVQLVGQNDPSALETDTRAILEQSGVPLLSRAAVSQRNARIQQQIAEETAASTPPVIDPQPGVAGVVQQPTQEGAAFAHRYIDPRQVINLSERVAHFGELANTSHVQDPVIMAEALALRDEWERHLTNQYGSFAEFLEEQEAVELAERGAVERANELLSRWLGDAKSTAPARRTMAFLRGVVERAGRIELGRNRLETEWDPEADAVRAWIRDHAASSLQSIDETTRKEMRDFLANAIEDGKDAKDIAREMRTKFEDRPGWRATRVARTEVRDAYNAGTLLAGKQAGLSMAQALDAQDGSTDEGCQDRNGRFFDIDEALATREHPNGTLGWRLVPAKNLSVQHVDIIPDMPDASAYYDRDANVVYAKTGLPGKTLGRYLLRLGEDMTANGFGSSELPTVTSVAGVDDTAHKTRRLRVERDPRTHLITSVEEA